MAYRQSDFTFTNGYRNGKLTRWMEVLRILRNMPHTKRFMLMRIWHYTNEDFTPYMIHVNNDNTYQRMYAMSENCALLRGKCSHLFGCMRGANLIDYDKTNRTWFLTDLGRETYKRCLKQTR